MAEVKLKNIAKSYDGKTMIVEDVSFDIHDTEFLVLVGPSGCGKSTILRMIAGLEEITSGDLYIDEKRVNDLQPKDRDIAMVFQNYALYPHMTVYKNMAFGLKIKKVPKKEIDERVRKAAEVLEITELLDRRPGAMSGGQRQRVAIGRAIVRDPKVFLFDEPLSNLDAKLRVAMRVELQKLHQKLNATMVYVTHDQTEAMTLGDRIVVLKDGDIMQIGTPMELYHTPQNIFVAGFIGSPPINFIEGKIIKDSSVWFYQESSGLKIDLSKVMNSSIHQYIDKRVVFGIRPENIKSGQTAAGSHFHKHPADVVAQEQMGNEILVYTQMGGNQLIARFSPEADIKIDAPTDLYFNLDKASFFDPITEAVIL
jgi:multiple sugar transport system ATP-binding protein